MSHLSKIAFAAGLLASAAAHAQASTKPSDVKPGHYVVETNHTQIVFGVSHFGFSTYYGFFSGATGSLDIAPQASADRFSISIPVNSVHTTSPKLDGELNEWFGAAQFPNATFVSTSVKRTGAATADITGDFTLHGVTKPLVLHAHLMGSGVNPLDKATTVGFSATGTVKRSEFGITKYVPYVGDDVALTLTGAFELKG